VHEMAHEMLHRSERRTLTTKQVRETEAEAVAFVVCQSIGLQTGTASADYIQLWNGDAKLLAESLEVVQRTAAVILGAISPRPTTSEEAETANQTQAEPAPIAQPPATAEEVSGVPF
jgi:DNA transposition AAA+ family ATPase